MTPFEEESTAQTFSLDRSVLVQLSELRDDLARSILVHERPARGLHDWALLLHGLDRLPLVTPGLLVSLSVEGNCGPDATRWYVLAINEHEVEISVIGSDFCDFGSDRYHEPVVHAWVGGSSGDAWDLEEWVMEVKRLISQGTRPCIRDEGESWPFEDEEEDEDE